ncbi:iodothyronine deiodinase [Thecamonas trahens ATCC 50062]|uniref:Iodothyronine deiodinase n=1 Tax=Thecamonas trahens ATCC 50062 TaxID=461836 RepID=A0A0L0DG69_THETB|nr:iodothyronine deiodinase [Thecamonas trahens ATCC 50062]KNC51324.1 iodothyronine deiodinase [Thecamonas trahens ATCC 50062]|eukprot:XP_013756246.1 iodothyronine deiodinase [Thecamonas trahens ATCC 50062]
MAAVTEDSATPGLPPVRFGDMTEDETAARIKMLLETEGEARPYLHDAFPASNVLVEGSPMPDLSLLRLDGSPAALGADIIIPALDSSHATGVLAAAAETPLFNVYIREAHAEDDWAIEVNTDDDVCFPQPKSTAARLAVANDFVATASLDPAAILVDPIENEAEAAFEARPERLYAIARVSGVLTVVFRTGIGPYMYSVTKLKAFLDSCRAPH